MKIIQNIPLSHIDLNDDTFSINFMPDLERLRESINVIGPIQPVLLRKGQGGHTIVCGFRRISVLQDLGISEVDAKVVSAQEMDDLQLFSIALHENATCRGFNPVEIGIALDKLTHRFGIDPKVVVRRYLPLFSQETNEKILDTFLSLAKMEEETKRYVVRETVSRSNIRRLASLTSEDRGVLLTLISPLKLGENRLREILTLVKEIAQRNDRPVREIVRHPEIQATLTHPEFTPSQKAERVRKVLVHLRYPRLCRLEEEFDQKKRNLRLPSTLSLRHQPYFESKGLRVEFQFETLEEYRSLLSQLSQLSDNKEFRALFERSEEALG